MKSIWNNILAVALLLGSLVSGAQPRTESPLVVDKIIARVDNYIILESDLEAVYQSYITAGNPPSEDAKCKLLNRLFVEKLMVAKANLDSIVVTDEEVNANTDQRIQMILQNSGNSSEELEKIYGKTMEEIKLDLRERVREQMLSNKMMQHITKDISVTPSEVKRFFKRIPADSLPFYSSDVEVAHIVKIAEINSEQKQKTRDRLMQLRKRILAGESFNELARKYSEDPSATRNGGEMGYVGRGNMVSAYEAVAFKLKKGELSMPFESRFGFHLMQLLDRRGNEYNSRHILIAPTPSADDVERAKAFLDSLRMRIVQGETTFEKAAKEHSDDPATNSQGGFFTTSDGGFKISIKDIDPVTYFTIDTMKVGTISRAVAYRTVNGKSAARILYLKAKDPPHQAGLDTDWHRIQIAAIAEKKDRTLDEWFNKARKDISIKVAPEYRYCNILD